MKKIISIMVVLAVIATAAFATDFNINLGLGCGVNSGKQAEDKDNGFEEPKFSTAGFDIQLGFNAELNNRLVIYDSLNFVIPGDLKRGFKDVDKEKIDGIDTKFLISEDVGAGYAFHFNAIRLIVGGGLHFDYLTYKYKKPLNTDACSNMNIGLNILVHGDYFFNEHFGAFLGLEPTVNFFNSWKDKELDGDKSGGALGFNGSFVAGATYKI